MKIDQPFSEDSSILGLAPRRMKTERRVFISTLVTRHSVFKGVMMQFPTSVLCLAVASCALVQVSRADRKHDPQWVFPRGAWERKAEELTQSGREDGVAAFDRRAAFGDVTVDVEFKADTNRPAPTVGVLFGSTDSQHCAFAHYDLMNGQVILYRAFPGPRFTEFGRKPGIPISYRQWHKARVEVRGKRVTAFLDGQEILTGADENLEPGLCGLRCDAGVGRFRGYRVEGKRARMSLKWRDTMPTQHYKVIVEDGGCGGFEAWPDVERLDNGELVVAFYAGYAHGSPPTDKLPNSGKMALVRSKDNGVTWGPVETIVDSRDDDHDGSLCQLSDGTLLCNYFVDIYYRRVDGREVRDNWWKIALRCVRSKDRGKTWSEPVEIEGPWNYVSATSDAILERDDGVLLMPVYGWEQTGPWQSGVLFSRDRGQSWGDFVVIEEDGAGKTCEPALVHLPGGRILCITRNKMAQSFSSDGGRTWSKPEILPFSGDAPMLLHTSKGLLLCAMRHNGTSVIVSEDEGKTWRGAYQLDTVGGAYPSMCELPDGTIFCVYYEEGEGSNIRAVRFRPKPEGIEFVPPAKWK